MFIPDVERVSLNILKTLSPRFFLAVGSLNAFMAVGLAALGKHGVLNRLGEHGFELFQTASQYQMNHGMGLILVGLSMHFLADSLWLRLAGLSMSLGILLFSGTLYLLAVSDFQSLAWATPVGGSAFLVSWLSLTLAFLKGEKQS